jgi:thioredoxin 1
MSSIPLYATSAPTREEVDAWTAPTLLEFGTDWCGHCQIAQGPIAQALAAYPGVRRVKIEDGRGRPLGRSFGVKLWPMLVFLKGHQEVARVVRPLNAQPVQHALAKLAAA